MKTGVLVAGRFRIELLAGAGGMGSVYLARDESTGQNVALKVLLPHGSQEVARFLREAKILATLEHPGIVRYVDHGVSDDGEPFLAMEWLDGESLDERLQRVGSLDLAEAVQIGLQVARALSEAHKRGVIHRDIKPSNIMCLSDGSVKVVDFGVATGGVVTSSATQPGRFVGTPGYIAPEQARGARNLDGRADLFSLGGVLYLCITGSPAFPGEHTLAILAKVVLDDPPRVSELCEGVPIQLDRLVMSMLAKAPEQRPADAEAVIQQLESVLDGFSRVDSRLPPSRQVLTRRELQVVSVVVAATYLHETIDNDGSTPIQDPRMREVPAIFDTLGVKLERLIDGSFLCVVRTGEAATDQAARAAMCALALHAAHPDIPIIVATGRGVFSGKLPVGEVIERAVAALREHRAKRSGSAPESSAWGPPSSRWRHLVTTAPMSTGVQIDSLTAGLLDARFDVRADDQGLWLFGQHERVDPVRTLLGQRVPFVGRERELAFLEATVSQCVDEEISRVTLVTADAGAGKSRLLTELLERVSKRTPRVEVWTARGTQISQASPLSLVAKIIRKIAAVEESDAPVVHRRKIEARARRCMADDQVARVAEFLTEACGVAADLSHSTQLNIAGRRPASDVGSNHARLV
ncbi:MAG: protein kinase [Polyangiaceae bacterium]